MKNINHRDIRLIFEDLVIIDTTICYELPMPKFILRRNRLFQKARTIFDNHQKARVAYSEILIANLEDIEVVTATIEVSHG